MTRGGLQVGGNFRGDWETDTAYNAGDLVVVNGSLTPVKVDHVSTGSTPDLTKFLSAVSGAGGGSTVVPIVAGNLGSTYTLDMQAKDEVRLFGTLNNSPLAITTTGWKSGVSRAELVLLKTAGVARTLTIDGASIPVLDLGRLGGHRP
jgi:hypothetical protein